VYSNKRVKDYQQLRSMLSATQISSKDKAKNKSKNDRYIIHSPRKPRTV